MGCVSSQGRGRNTVSNNGTPVVAVLDDDDSVRRAIRRLLRAAGFAVETFSSGGEFLRSLQRRRPDAVVLDLHMPGMSGFDVQARLAQMGERIPVVCITGTDGPNDRDRAIAGGAAAYLQKPPDGPALLDAVAAAVVRAKA